MSDLERIQRDKATILSIIKYLLIFAIAAFVVYFGFQLFWILMPFVIGYILAKAANNLACAWKDMLYRHKRRRITKASAAQTSTAAQETVVPQAAKPVQAQRRKHGCYPQGLARSKREIHLAVFFYILEVIALFGMVVGVIIISLSQARTIINYLPAFIRDNNLSRSIIDSLSQISNQFGGIFPAEFLQSVETELAHLQERLIAAMPDIASSVLNALGSIAAFLPILIFIIVVVIMSGYYFITDTRRLYIVMRRNITSKSFREKSIRLVNSLSTTLFRVVGGYLLLLVLTFIQALIGLVIIKMPYAVVVALIAAVVDFLPVLGMSATLIPVALYMFFNGNIIGGLGALILLAIMTLTRRIIEPAILGTAMKLHPMATLASMIIGIALYGLTGILVGPIVMVIAKEVVSLYGFDKKIRELVGTVLTKVSP